MFLNNQPNPTLIGGLVTGVTGPPSKGTVNVRFSSSLCLDTGFDFCVMNIVADVVNPNHQNNDSRMATLCPKKSAK